jgi:uracil-DNA glycosylase
MLACRRCIQAGYDITPPAIFRGQAQAKVMLIGQAPGITEVEAGRPFNAGSGRRLFQWLAEAGWGEEDFRARHYITAVTKCYPGKAANGKGDRVPSKAEQQLCRPFLEREISLINPRLMILVGSLAIKLLFPPSARLEELIGTALYFPSTLTPSLNLSLQDSHQLLLPTLPSPFPNPQSPISNLSSPLPPNGRFILPLPHPSGASLWPNKPANQALISQAIQLLALIREAYHL